MFRTQGVLGLLALCVGLVHSFAWDIVVARSNRLEFYNEGTLAHTATIASHRIKWITYDPVHDRVLFAEKYNREDSASSFDIANQTTQSLIKKTTNRYINTFAYDPATELLFGTVTKSIYSFPLGPGNNNDVNGDLVITLETIPREVAVDSCGGHIYWRANNIIERALFNGSEREVIIDNSSNATIQGLIIDSQKIYWIETQEYYDGGFSIESADLDGNNRRTLYSDTESDSTPDRLTVSKDFISWGDSIEKVFGQLPKNPTNKTDMKPNKIAMNTTISSCSSDIAANYKIEERTQGVPNCNALLSLLPDVCLKASEFCVHGTKVIGESRCDCLQGYTGERCDMSVCENYCSQGSCSLSAEGQPTCRCHAGYTGERCDTLVCENYCYQGDCNVSAEGQPKCRCNAGYTGERCDTSVCENYCYQGDCNVSAEGQPKCRCNAGYTSERCDISLCENYCLQGDCNFSADGQPKCRCNAGYTGERCDISICENYCLQGDCNVTAEGHPKCRCNAGYSGNRCDVSACHKHCLNDGICSLNAKDEPVCQCTEQYEGGRCEVLTALKEVLRLHWLPLVNGKLPPGAMIGGFENDNATYIARANHSDSLCPGKYVKSTGTAFVPWEGKEYSKEQFEILCGFSAKWVQTSSDNIPKNAFVGGRTSESDVCKVAGKPLYICRAKIGKKIVTGKAYPCMKLCYLPFKGKEKEISSYEILVEE